MIVSVEHHVGSSVSGKVFQSPANIFSSPDGTATISCSHSIPNYDQILWYKQEDNQMLLLGYVYYGSAHPEAGVDVTMDGSAEKDQNCTLTINRLSLKSSGVYFCAARYHSATKRATLRTKTSSSRAAMFVSGFKHPHTCRSHSFICLCSDLLEGF